MKFIQQAYKGKNKWTGYLKTFGITVLVSQILAVIRLEKLEIKTI